MFRRPLFRTELDYPRRLLATLSGAIQPIRACFTPLPQFGLTAGIDIAPKTQPQFVLWGEDHP
jgi:hypothetical protein